MEQEGKNTIQKSVENFLVKETGKRLLFTDKVDWDVSVTPMSVKVSITLSQKTDKFYKLFLCARYTPTRMRTAPATASGVIVSLRTMYEVSIATMGFM